jgi:hypothetical protein
MFRQNKGFEQLCYDYFGDSISAFWVKIAIFCRNIHYLVTLTQVCGAGDFRPSVRVWVSSPDDRNRTCRESSPWCRTSAQRYTCIHVYIYAYIYVVCSDNGKSLEESIDQSGQLYSQMLQKQFMSSTWLVIAELLVGAGQKGVAPKWRQAKVWNDSTWSVIVSWNILLPQVCFQLGSKKSY